MRRVLLGCVALFTLLIVSYAAVILWAQGSLIYVPLRTTPALAAAARSNGAERLEFNVKGHVYSAWWIPPTVGAPRTLWVACIGNGGCAASWFEQPGFLLPTLHRASGAAILAVDYPGFGENSGSPDPVSILALSRAAQAAVLARLGWKRAEVRIAALGLSLGSGIASQHAVAEGLDRLVLLAPYTSLLDLAKAQQPWPFWHLLRHRFDNRAAIQTLASRPGALVVIYHGTDDRTIPVTHGRALAEIAPGVVRLHELAGAGHADVITHALPMAVHEMQGMLIGSSTPGTLR